MYTVFRTAVLRSRAKQLARLTPCRPAAAAAGPALWPALTAAAGPQQPPPRRLIVAGIETSCDDTGVAFLSLSAAGGSGTPSQSLFASKPDLASVSLLSHVLSSQHHLHAPYSGIVPNIASRAHAAALPWVWQQASAEAHAAQGGAPLSAVAVTTGPGLSMCLRVGLGFARGDDALVGAAGSGGGGYSTAASALPPGLPRGTPIIPVNHLEGHLLIPRYVYGPDALPFPYLVLLVSGGHTLVAVAHGVGRYAVLGSTLDDSLGECFDKVARMVEATTHAGGAEGGGHLGALLEALALRPGADPRAIKLPVPLRSAPPKAYPTPHAAVPRFERHRPPPIVAAPSVTPVAAVSATSATAAAAAPVVAFSFSGLKSAVQRYVTRPGVDVRDPAVAANIAASFHAAVSKHCSDQLLRALSHLDASGEGAAIRTVVVCGGAARNSILRGALTAAVEGAGRGVLFPPPGLCTDNGIMAAWAGVEVLTAAAEARRRGEHGVPYGVAGQRQATDASSSGAVELDVNPRWRLGSAPPLRPLVSA